MRLLVTSLLKAVCAAGLLLISQCAPLGQTDGTVSMQQESRETMPTGFVYLDEVAPLVLVDLRYAGNNNFVGRPLAGYNGKRAILRKETAYHLKAASEWFNKQGYRILVYDAYRPHTAMIDINRWAKNKNDDKMKSTYYPNISKERIFEDLYLRDFSEHSRGSAVDITLVQADTGRPIDMGGHFDLLDPSSALDYSGIRPQQQKNRQYLKQSMAKFGFASYAPEWWHYRLSPEPDEESHFLFPLNDRMRPFR